MIIKKRVKWHIPNTNIRKQEEINAELIIKQQPLQWAPVLTVVLQSNITGYVLSAVFTGVSLPLRKRQQPDLLN